MGRIKVGGIKEVFDRGDGLDAYVSVEVTIDGAAVRVGTMIGVRPSDKESVRRHGNMGHFLRTWLADNSDFDNVARGDYEAVADALSDEAERLWEEFETANEPSFHGDHFE